MGQGVWASCVGGADLFPVGQNFILHDMAEVLVDTLYLMTDPVCSCRCYGQFELERRDKFDLRDRFCLRGFEE